LITVDEDVLNRLADDELTPLERESILSALELDAKIQQQLSKIKRLKLNISKGLVTETLPPFDISRLPVPNRSHWKVVTFAVSLALVIGFSMGRYWTAPEDTLFVTNQAVGAHLVYAAELKHPVEVFANEEAHLLGWLSKRLDRTVIAPDLARFSFTLLGGRLLVKGDKPAAQLMYERTDGVRVTLYLAQGNMENSEFRFEAGDQASAFYWQDDQTTFALIGALPRETLLNIAQASYDQL